MNRAKRSVLAVLSLFLAGCATGGIDPEAIDGLCEKIRQRHDAYVEADESLSDFEKRTYLDSTAQLERVVQAAKAVATR